MRTQLLNGTWFLYQKNPTEDFSVETFCMTHTPTCQIPHMPMQVQETLAAQGIIRDPALRYAQEECLWVAESDWIYRTQFSRNELAQQTSLVIHGIDTIANIYLNGVLISHAEDAYLPVVVDVTEQLSDENDLQIHMISNHYYLKTHPVIEEWQGKVRWYRGIRSFEQGYTNYLGPQPYFTRMGIYDAVELQYTDIGHISSFRVEATLNDDLTEGSLVVDTVIDALGGSTSYHLSLFDPVGNLVSEQKAASNTQLFVISQPDLWWPIGYGNHPLYTIRGELYHNGTLLDMVEKRIGFRRLQMDEHLHCHINNISVTLWGANLTPCNGITNVYDPTRMNKLLHYAKHAHMNILRVWGSTELLKDDFYDACDRDGILLWQEFFHNYGMYPEDDAFRALCRKEATHLIRRLSHRPSIILWCGGNECFMGAQFSLPDVPYIGGKLFTEDYKKIAQQEDPHRFYLENSPSGGAFANDPREGDTHNYTHMWFVPGSDMPNFASENCRVGSPALRSMRYFLGDDLWPQDESLLYTYHNRKPWPSTWEYCTSSASHEKVGPIHEFYDADNPKDTVYRLNAAYAKYIHQNVERYRRGKILATETDRRCHGHILWKFNASWFHIYTSVLDYYLEPEAPYYALRRAYTPLLLTMDMSGDCITIWGVNDTPSAVEASLEVQLLDISNNAILRQKKMDVAIPAGASLALTNLDDFHQFMKRHVVSCVLRNPQGEMIASTQDFADIERNLIFPDATLSAELDGDEIVITSNYFARCVTLEEADSDAFGYFFSDNYFDLMPNTPKRISLLNDAHGRIRIGTQYTTQEVFLEL